MSTTTRLEISPGLYKTRSGHVAEVIKKINNPLTGMIWLVVVDHGEWSNPITVNESGKYFKDQEVTSVYDLIERIEGGRHE